MKMIKVPDLRKGKEGKTRIKPLYKVKHLESGKDKSRKAKGV